MANVFIQQMLGADNTTLVAPLTPEKAIYDENGKFLSEKMVEVESATAKAISSANTAEDKAAAINEQLAAIIAGSSSPDVAALSAKVAELEADVDKHTDELSEEDSVEVSLRSIDGLTIDSTKIVSGSGYTLYYFLAKAGKTYSVDFVFTSGYVKHAFTETIPERNTPISDYGANGTSQKHYNVSVTANKYYVIGFATSGLTSISASYPNSGLGVKVKELEDDVKPKVEEMYPIVLGQDEVSIKETANFINKGIYITNTATFGTSSNYYMSDPVKVSKGDVIEVYGTTPSNTYLMVATDDGTPFTSADDRTLRVIVTRNGGTYARQTWTTDKDCYVIAQSYIQATAWSNFELKLTKPSIDEKISMISDNGNELPLDKELSYAKTNYNAVSLLWFSDIHGGNTYTKQLKKIMDQSADYASLISDIIHTGDSVASYAEDFGDWWTTAGASKVLNVIGNHDVWQQSTGETDLSAADTYTKYFAPYISQWNVTHDGNTSHCYYYKDYANGVRLIVVDYMHITDDQTTWLTTTLADAKTNSKSVVIACHYQPMALKLFDCPFTSVKADSGIGNVTAWVNAVDSYIADGGEFVCWIVGHTHRDYVGVIDGHEEQVVIVAENGCCRSDGNDGVRVLGEDSELSYNIISFDTTNKVVNVIRVGNKYDMYCRHKEVLTIDYATQKIVGCQ